MHLHCFHFCEFTCVIKGSGSYLGLICFRLQHACARCLFRLLGLDRWFSFLFSAQLTRLCEASAVIAGSFCCQERFQLKSVIILE